MHVIYGHQLRVDNLKISWARHKDELREDVAMVITVPREEQNASLLRPPRTVCGSPTPCRSVHTRKEPAGDEGPSAT